LKFWQSFESIWFPLIGGWGQFPNVDEQSHS